MLVLLQTCTVSNSSNSCTDAFFALLHTGICCPFYDICACAACLISAAEALLPEVPKLDRSQITASFIVGNAKAVAGIGMAVLGAGVIVMILLTLLGNVGLNQDQHSSDGAYAPATVEVHAHKKVRASPCMGLKASCAAFNGISMHG